MTLTHRSTCRGSIYSKGKVQRHFFGEPASRESRLSLTKSVGLWSRLKFNSIFEFVQSGDSQNSVFEMMKFFKKYFSEEHRIHRLIRGILLDFHLHLSYVLYTRGDSSRGETKRLFSAWYK